MILLDIFLFPRIKLVTITQTWSFWASVFHKALVYFAGRWWFALWRRNHQESIFSKVLDALYWAQAKCSEISAQYDLWKSFKRAAWQVCTCHLVLSYNEPVCLIHINDVCFFSYVFFSVSYKLWYNYLRERRKQVKGKCVTDPTYEEVNNCHERALVFMHKVKLTFHAFSCLFGGSTVWQSYLCDLMVAHSLSPQMPRIWIDYCQFMVSQCKITRSRRTFDRALRALPVTQHPRIWPLYLRFGRNLPLPETAIRVFRRYLKVRDGHYAEYQIHAWLSV